MNAAQRLEAYLDDELDPGDAADFLRDVESDPALDERFQTRRAALTLLRQAEPVAPPPSFAWLVRQRIRRRLARRRARTGHVGLAAEVVAAAVMVLVLGVSSVALSPIFEPPAATALDRVALTPAVEAELRRFGAVEAVGLAASGTDLVVRLALTPGTLESLRASLAGRSDVRLAHEPDLYGRVELVARQ